MIEILMRPVYMLTLLTIGSLLPAKIVRAQEEVVFLIKHEHLSCIQRNSEKYSKIEYPSFISLIDCPEIPSNPLLSALRQEGPDIEERNADDEPDFFLYLNIKQFECLNTIVIANDAGVLRIKPDSCTVSYE